MDALVPDLSLYLVAGRVTATPRPGCTHVGRALEDGVEAEQLGFRRVWLSERFDLKDAGVLLSGIAARTTRLGVGTGALSAASRHAAVTASFGSSMHALYGPRFVLGLGRGTPMMDMPEVRLRDLQHYAAAVRAIWQGEAVDYTPPGKHEPVRLSAVDALEGIPRPEIWYCTYGGPRAAETAAAGGFDGVMLYPFLTVEAVGRAVRRVRRACEAVGRDPSSIRVCHPIVVASGLDEATTRSYAHARLVTYLDWPGHGETLVRSNEWDPALLDRVRGHEQLRSASGRNADQSFHRAELLGVSEVLDDDLVTSSAAIGTAQECVALLNRYRRAGVDEIAIYGSTPQENEDVIAAWRERGPRPHAVAVDAGEREEQ